MANDGVDATIDSHIDEAAPRLPSTNITALAVRPLTAMHTGAEAVDIDRDAVFSPAPPFRAQFASVLLEGVPLAVTGAQTILTLRVVDAACESIRTNRPVPLSAC